jgi:hypothetical protein
MIPDIATIVGAYGIARLLQEARDDVPNVWRTIQSVVATLVIVAMLADIYSISSSSGLNLG